MAAAYAVAARTGIDGLTVRAVAERAGLSHGLVHFHFESRNRLVGALLERVLALTSVLEVSADVAGIPGTLDRFHALLRREMERLSQAPAAVRLFLEFWALGTRDPAVRARISEALEGYRAAFRVLTAEVLRAEPAAFAGVTPDGLAAVAVSFV
ncbi:MAG TPA: TetR/AcrR family transcriptional regulator, partial [Longimicrobiaceae bacterium]|nr:TetR/AcrR family transcriptional regulator [Longimicrobiaceae bacterium]